MGSSEKFCLKWNDFQTNVSKTFAQLRRESGLFDVTLVTNDQQQVSAHRLVLSACSDFFKTIFHSNTHSHPLLYLDCVNSREINLVLDYIYQGEVQIFQEHLGRFLEVAEKFNLDGLQAGNFSSSEGEEFTNSKHEDTENSYEGRDGSTATHAYSDYGSSSSSTRQIVKKNSSQQSFNYTKTLKLLNEHEDNKVEIESKFQKLVVEENNSLTCIICAYIAKKPSDMKRHLEKHIDGLSYDCQFCEKTFRTSSSLRVHCHTKHGTKNK